MRGILLAGGLNTRLRPASLAAPKSLMPVWDSPLIYHPLCALMACGAREILTIAAPQWLAAHKRLLGDGSAWGIRVSYAAQRRPAGIADAYRLGAKFLAGGRSALALCDNIFFGAAFERAAHRVAERDGGEWGGATVFVKEVEDPRRFGVATLTGAGKVANLVEKPANPESHWAVTGFYICDGEAAEIAARQSPSERGELEITDLLRVYARRGELRATKLGDDVEWLDAGTPEDLALACRMVSERRKGGKVLASPELAALRRGWISRGDFRETVEKLGNCDYAKRVLRDGIGF